MSLVKGEMSKIKLKHGLVEFCSFLFPNSYVFEDRLARYLLECLFMVFATF